jgi:hypothetical protein
MLGLHNCDVWHTFARSENHKDWVKGLTSTRQEAGFTMLNAASADAVKGEQHAGNEVRPYGLCLWWARRGSRFWRVGRFQEVCGFQALYVFLDRGGM